MRLPGAEPLFTTRIPLTLALLLAICVDGLIGLLDVFDEDFATAEGPFKTARACASSVVPGPRLLAERNDSIEERKADPDRPSISPR